MATCSDGNGGKTKLDIERRDWLKIGGFVFGLTTFTLTSAVAAAMYVFQTKAEAAVVAIAANEKHAEIEQQAALDKQAVEMQKEFDSKGDSARDLQIKAMGAGLSAIHSNQQRMMIEDGYKRREIKPLPAGLDIDMTKINP